MNTQGLKKSAEQTEEIINKYHTNDTMQLLGHQYINPLITPGGIGREDFEKVFDANHLPMTGSFLETGIDLFCLGYLYGKRAERAHKSRKDLTSLTTERR